MSALAVSVGKVAGVASGVAVLGEIAALVKEIVTLYDDVKATSSMFTDLVDKVTEEEPEIRALVDSGKFPSVDALQKYTDHLVEIKEFLEAYKEKSLLGRFIRISKSKDRIQQFYIKSDRLRFSLGLQFQRSIADTLERMDADSKSVAKQQQQQLDEIWRLLTGGNLFKLMGQDVIGELTDARYEVDHGHSLTEAQKEELKSILLQNLEAANLKLSRVSVWHISEGDIRVNKPAIVTRGASNLYFGKLIFGARVAITRVELAPEEIDAFKKQITIWYELRNPHVIPLYGANAVAEPAFFAMAHAAKGSFNDFLPNNQHLLWKVFLDAARGLAYLHSRSIIHAHLKCSNLLVMADGTGVVSDFAYAFLRPNSALSEKTKAESSLNWHAPECMRLGSAGNARKESDVYSLGMCLFEALTGAPPYDGLANDEIIEKKMKNELPARPVDKISYDAWDLITRMCAEEFQDRIAMDSVVRYLEDWVARVQYEQLVCGCDGGVCSSCGKHFTSRSNGDCP